MRPALNAGLILSIGLCSVAVAQPVQKISTCFEEYLAALVQSQLEDGIAHCDKVIDDKTTPPQRRGEALAQRGLMYARRWAVVAGPGFAIQGIRDITDSLVLHTPPVARRHQLLTI